MTYFPQAARRGRTLALALCSGLTLACTLTACDEDNPTAIAIRDAEAKIRALTPAGAQPVSVAYRKETYTKIKNSLQGASGGTKSDAATAQVLLAQSNAGLAQIPAAEASNLYRDSLHEQVEARAVLGQWLQHMAIADASGKFDPSKEIADNIAELKTVEAALAKAQQQKTQIDGHVSQLQTQAKQKSDEASALRQQSGALRAKLPNETAVSGAELLKQAREIDRKADGLEVEGSNLDAQSQQIAPQSGEVQLDIDKLNLQTKLLADGRASVQKRTDDAKAQAKQSHDNADKVAANLDVLVQSLLKRQDDIKTQTEAAVSGYAAAEKSAKAAMTELRGTASMALASTQQSSGDASWTLAQSYESLADTLESIAKAAFPPPNASDLAAKAAEARTAAKAALDAATASYQGAIEAYDKAGAKAQAAEVMEKLTNGLKRSVKITSGGSIDLGATEKPQEAEKPASTGAAPAGGGGDVEAVRAMMQTMIDDAKAGHFETLMSSTHVTDPDQRKAMSDMLGLLPKFKALNDAVKEKFGEGMQGLDQMTNGIAAPGAADANVPLSDVKIEVNGDKATATFPSGKSENVVKVDGKWLMEPSEADMALLRTMGPKLVALGPDIDQLTSDVKSGKVPTAQAAQLSLMGKFAKVMGMGGMGKGDK